MNRKDATDSDVDGDNDSEKDDPSSEDNNSEEEGDGDPNDSDASSDYREVDDHGDDPSNWSSNDSVLSPHEQQILESDTEDDNKDIQTQPSTKEKKTSNQSDASMEDSQRISSDDDDHDLDIQRVLHMRQESLPAALSPLPFSLLTQSQYDPSDDDTQHDRIQMSDVRRSPRGHTYRRGVEDELKTKKKLSAKKANNDSSGDDIKSTSKKRKSSQLANDDQDFNPTQDKSPEKRKKKTHNEKSKLSQIEDNSESQSQSQSILPQEPVDVSIPGSSQPKKKSTDVDFDKRMKMFLNSPERNDNDNNYEDLDSTQDSMYSPSQSILKGSNKSPTNRKQQRVSFSDSEDIIPPSQPRVRGIKPKPLTIKLPGVTSPRQTKNSTGKKNRKDDKDDAQTGPNNSSVKKQKDQSDRDDTVKDSSVKKKKQEVEKAVDDFTNTKPLRRKKGANNNKSKTTEQEKPTPEEELVKIQKEKNVMMADMNKMFRGKLGEKQNTVTYWAKMQLHLLSQFKDNELRDDLMEHITHITNKALRGQWPEDKNTKKVLHPAAATGSSDRTAHDPVYQVRQHGQHNVHQMIPSIVPNRPPYNYVVPQMQYFNQQPMQHPTPMQQGNMHPQQVFPQYPAQQSSVNNAPYGQNYQRFNQSPSGLQNSEHNRPAGVMMSGMINRIGQSNPMHGVPTQFRDNVQIPDSYHHQMATLPHMSQLQQPVAQVPPCQENHSVPMKEEPTHPQQVLGSMNPIIIDQQQATDNSCAVQTQKTPPRQSPQKNYVTLV